MGRTEMNLCALCAEKKIFREAVHTHHLISGNGRRQKADEFGLTIPLCYACHEKIHDNPDLLIASKYVGQLMYERDRTAEGQTKEQARSSFIKEFGKSYLWD